MVKPQQLAKGYNGRILRVNLTEGRVDIETPDYDFYRRYMGGSGWGTYFLLRETPAGADPFDENSLLVYSLSVVTGAPIPGFSRMNMNAKSPLTGAIGDSQAGGFFPAFLKFAGFDAIVITGKAPSPVYLWIHDGICEIRDASHIWGKDTGETEETIQQELGNKRVRVSAIGVGGENLVSYACVLNERKFAAGRTGMGAVMGSKKLKAVAVYGEPANLEFHDRDRLLAISRAGVKTLQTHSLKETSQYGSALGVDGLQAVGGLPTRNWKSGVFDKAHMIGSESMRKSVHTGKHETCYACYVHCKQVAAAEEPYSVDPSYGSPEYETLASLGSYIGVGDPVAVSKANELCNRYSIDTISTGAAIAFAMDCYESGIIGKEDTDGLDLKFGNADAALELITKIATRQGLGDILARGVYEASKVFGKDSAQHVVEVKKNPFPAHDPRTKASLALAYAICPFGADHVSSEHDPAVGPGASEQTRERYRALALYDEMDPTALDSSKAAFFYHSQLLFSAYDTLDVCLRAYGLFELDVLSQALAACTGWQTSLYEILKAGERRWNLMRCFNAREGFTKKDDYLPPRMYEPMIDGPTEGLSINREQFEAAKDIYYQMAGWDTEKGWPTKAKLAELGISWALPTDV